jgi:hypothetical protein
MASSYSPTAETNKKSAESYGKTEAICLLNLETRLKHSILGTGRWWKIKTRR